MLELECPIFLCKPAYSLLLREEEEDEADATFLSLPRRLEDAAIL